MPGGGGGGRGGEEVRQKMAQVKCIGNKDRALLKDNGGYKYPGRSEGEIDEKVTMGVYKRILSLLQNNIQHINP